MLIAVGFDGTIVENKYPEIGEPLLFAIDSLKMLQEKQHQLVLWTPRKGEKLQEAVSFCKQRGLHFYAVNASYEEEIYNATISRKISADVFIDCKNIGGIPSWGEIFHLLADTEYLNKVNKPEKKPTLLDRLFKTLKKS
jgi:hypothetical protein